MEHGRMVGEKALKQNAWKWAVRDRKYSILTEEGRAQTKVTPQKGQQNPRLTQCLCGPFEVSP